MPSSESFDRGWGRVGAVARGGLGRGALVLGLGLGLGSGCGPVLSPAGSDGQEGGTASSGAASSSTTTTGSGSPGSSATGAGDTTTGGPVLPPPGCGCSDVPNFFCDDDDPLFRIDCGGAELCPPLEVTCSRPDTYYACLHQEEVVDAEVLDCALQAARQRTPGRIQIDRPGTTCGLEGCGELQTIVTIRPAADPRYPTVDVVVSELDREPLSCGRKIDSLRELAEPSYFAECGELSTTGARLGCFEAGLRSIGLDVECP